MRAVRPMRCVNAAASTTREQSAFGTCVASQRTGVLWRVPLNDPVDVGKVDTTRRHIGDKQNAALQGRKALQQFVALLCRNLAVKRKERRISKLRKRAHHFVHVVDGGARQKVHNDLLGRVLLQKPHERVEFAVQRHHRVVRAEALRQRLQLARFRVLHFDANAHGIAQAGAHQLFDAFRLRGGKEPSAALLGQKLNWPSDDDTTNQNQPAQPLTLRMALSAD